MLLALICLCCPSTLCLLVCRVAGSVPSRGSLPTQLPWRGTLTSSHNLQQTDSSSGLWCMSLLVLCVCLFLTLFCSNSAATIPSASSTTILPSHSHARSLACLPAAPLAWSAGECDCVVFARAHGGCGHLHAHCSRRRRNRPPHQSKLW